VGHRAYLLRGLSHARDIFVTKVTETQALFFVENQGAEERREAAVKIDQTPHSL
jgi:hypothetical protein